MSNAASLRFSCNACKKSYGFKPELANKKVKCKCGAVVLVPDLSAEVAEDTYDFAEEKKPAIPVAKPVRAGVSVARSPVTAATPSRGKPPVLGYKSGPTARDRTRASEDNIYDYKRDFYIPAALIAGSFVILIACVMGGVIRGASPATMSIAFTIFAVINAAMMIGGALFIGGKVGISFGEPLTAILKFIAIAFFVGMITTIIDEKFGLLGMAVLSIAVSAVLYTALFVYLFSMDLEDSIWMVCFFIGVRTALSWLLLPILLGFVGGFFGGGSVTIGGGVAPSMTTAQQEIAQRFEDNKELGLIEEAVDYVGKGRQASWSDAVTAGYAAGAEYIGFAVTRDINGRGDPYSLMIKMPADPIKRAAIIKAMNDARAKLATEEYKPGVIVDNGGEYIETGI